MRSLYTLPHDAERDTYLVLNDFGASRLRLARPTLKAPAATTNPIAMHRSKLSTMPNKGSPDAAPKSRVL